jgi:hypothetical protein
MPGPIRDKQISTFVQQLKQQPEQKIDNKNVLQLLAAVGDNDRTDSTSLLNALSRPGVSRQEQFDLAKAGISNKERADIETLLGSDQIQWTPEAKNFAEALIGRAPLQTGDNSPVTIPDALRTSLQSLAKPGETLEVVNISANPEAANNGDKMEVKVDQWGRFNGSLNNVQEGDHLRVRTRGSNGNISNWISLQASGLGERDTRNAQIDTKTLGIEAKADGSLDLIHIGDGMVSEPNAQLRFTNERTGERFDFRLTAEGQLPADLKLKGAAGDNFSIAISDGTNNIDFREIAGTTKVEGRPAPVDLPDPEPWKERHVNPDGTPSVGKARFTGPLFVDGINPDDVKQGQLANCYFPAAVSAVAVTHPEVLKDMIKENPDGTYSVTFKEPSFSGTPRQRTVTVDGDLYTRPNGTALYGASRNAGGKEEMEMWYPILEKAYAAYKGNSYDKIGNGGSTADVLGSLLGVHTNYRTLDENTMDGVFKSMQAAQEKGLPMTTATYGKDGPEAERYAGVRIYPWHAYTVMSVREEDGNKIVQLRNPWGSSEPGNDGKDDGIFELPLKDFAHYFSGVTFAR